MDAKHRQPAFLLAILALLGASSLPRVFKGPDGAAPPSLQENAGAATPTATPSGDEGDDRTGRDIKDLKPLLDCLSDGEPGKEPVDDGGLGKYLQEHLFSEGSPDLPTVHCLVVALPEPVASVAGLRFDEYLDVVQRAIELQGYVLDRSTLPWRPGERQPVDPPDRTTRLRALGRDVLRAESTTPARPRAERPGLVVFKTPFGKAEPPRQFDILLAFIVPESPSSGINRGAFRRSIDLIDKYFRDRLELEDAGSGGGPDGRRVLHIVAPNFDGSQWSLEAALRAWKPGEGNRTYHLRILSNNAGRIEQDHLIKAANEGGHVLTFRSMVHRTRTVVGEMLDYLHEELGYEGDRLALLVESNSGMAQAVAGNVLRSGTGDGSPLAEDFIFPVQVSEVRNEYLKRGLLGSGELDTAGSPERLPIRPDESGAPEDIPHAFTPVSSAALDEIALTQILTTISRRRYQAVGILASNSLDLVFLARQVHRFCPNVRIFTTQADLLFSRPENSSDLRGMLVASTYSLYPPNQWFITPAEGKPHVPFSNQGSEGLYNAVTAQLWEMGASGGAYGPQLLEFSPPYEERPTGLGPPVWISVVGERGLYPVQSRSASGVSSYVYDPTERPPPHPNPRASAAEFRRKRHDAMRPNPHILYWLCLLILDAACLVISGLTWVYARWANDPAKLELDSGFLGSFGFNRLLEYLNYEVRAKPGDAGPAAQAGRPASYNPQEKYEDASKNPYKPQLGAGIYLSLANLLTLAIATYVFFPMLVVMWPYVSGTHWLLYAGTIVAWSLSFASTVLSMPLVWGEVARKRLNEGHVPFEGRHRVLFGAAFAFALLVALFLCVVVYGDPGGWVGTRLDFERTTNLPSGVSPLFTAFFLGGVGASFVACQLARRRLYRRSYLPSTLSSTLFSERPARGSESLEILRRMRENREKIGQSITKPFYAARQFNPILVLALGILFILFFIRVASRGYARSFEGIWFDRCFLASIVVAAFLIVVHALYLLAVWTRTSRMLREAANLPLVQAFDRLPGRFKGWFFGDDDFELRKRLVLRQSTALRDRSTSGLAIIFEKVYPAESDWGDDLRKLRDALKDQGDELDSTRKVYPFLDRIWQGLPVEDIPHRSRSEGEPSPGGPVGAGAASWPLLPGDRARVTDLEHAILRDWVRMAEDLVALQIVRWFAPALSELLPIMKFLVVGSLSLLLALSSYPFDHGGWMMTAMGTMILVVIAVVSLVVVGVNRDELISRVSDTKPGQLTFDSGFIQFALTMIGPLVAALLAISFDLSDLLRSWFGPLFQLL